MKNAVRSAFGLAVLGGVVALVFLLMGVDRTDLVLDAYIVYACGLVALTAARVAARAFPEPRRVVPEMLAPTRRPQPLPESLQATQDVVALAHANEVDVHYRLRPALVDIAAAGLAARNGIDLQHDPGRAKSSLSPATWDLVRPDRPRPGDVSARGMSIASLAEVVDELERILPS